MPPGSCCVFGVELPGRYEYGALWGTSAPKAEYVKHKWAGAWVCTIFRNESHLPGVTLIREAVAATLAYYGAPPSLGMVTMVDPRVVAGTFRSVRTVYNAGTDKEEREFYTELCWGYSFQRAGFRLAICPDHMIRVDDCQACNGLAKDGKVVLQLLPCDMPEPMAFVSPQKSLLDEEVA
jgi:hypothetical protein